MVFPVSAGHFLSLLCYSASVLTIISNQVQITIDPGEPQQQGQGETKTRKQLHSPSPVVQVPSVQVPFASPLSGTDTPSSIYPPSATSHSLAPRSVLFIPSRCPARVVSLVYHTHPRQPSAYHTADAQRLDSPHSPPDIISPPSDFSPKRRRLPCNRRPGATAACCLHHTECLPGCRLLKDPSRSLHDAVNRLNPTCTIRR